MFDHRLQAAFVESPQRGIALDGRETSAWMHSISVPAVVSGVGDITSIRVAKNDASPFLGHVKANETKVVDSARRWDTCVLMNEEARNTTTESVLYISFFQTRGARRLEEDEEESARLAEGPEPHAFFPCIFLFRGISLEMASNIPTI